MPDLVVTDSATGFKAVKYQGLIAPLIEATKDLDNMCRMQGRQLASLSGRVKKLEVQADSVERKIRTLEQENSQLRSMLKAMDERLKLLESGGR